MKLDVDMLSTVPDAPPAAGPDRALDPPVAPLPGPGCPDVADGDVAVADGDAPVAEGDAAQPAASPITADISVAPTIHLPFPAGRGLFGCIGQAFRRRRLSSSRAAAIRRTGQR